MSQKPPPSAALFGHMAQDSAARLLALAFLVGALWAAAFHGKGAALALGLGAGLFHLARPGPSEALDKETGRGQ